MGDCIGCCTRRIVALLERCELFACRNASVEKLTVGLCAKASLEVSDAIELGFDCLNPSRIGLE